MDFDDYQDEFVAPDGQIYRDERMFVMNLSKGRVVQGGVETEQYILTTYRNVPSLPPCRTDPFETHAEAVAYLKQVEPLTPIVTYCGGAIEFEGTVEEIYEQWSTWLDERGLLSALSGFQHVPEYIAKRLKDYPSSDTPYVSVIKVDS